MQVIVLLINKSPLSARPVTPLCIFKAIFSSIALVSSDSDILVCCCSQLYWEFPSATTLHARHHVYSRTPISPLSLTWSWFSTPTTHLISQRDQGNCKETMSHLYVAHFLLKLYKWFTSIYRLTSTDTSPYRCLVFDVQRSQTHFFLFMPL